MSGSQIGERKPGFAEDCGRIPCATRPFIRCCGLPLFPIAAAFLLSYVLLCSSFPRPPLFHAFFCAFSLPHCVLSAPVMRL